MKYHNDKSLCVLALLFAAATASADVINVPGDRPTIQAAIDIAVNGDVVIVAEGEYPERINFLGRAITVRSTDPNDPGVVMNTIIDGGGSGSVVTCDSGEESDTVLSGFVITGGSAPEGGGMRNVGSSPTVTNCSFIGNHAVAAQGVTLGGGMYNTESSPTVSDCTFSGNTAGNSGGGMHSGLNCSPMVSNCTFSGNTAALGGGMTIANNSSGTVSACTFDGNTASSGGGGLASSLNANPTVSNCTFNGNTAANLGGGMYSNFNSTPTVTDSGFCDNAPDAIAGDPIIDGGSNSYLCPCPDLDGDGNVGITDLLDLLADWGSPYGITDFLALLAHWGPCS